MSELRNKLFWEKLTHSWSIHFTKNWPYGVVAQIIVFIVILFGLGNVVIMLISLLFLSILEWMGIQPSDPSALYDACVYFLKNMSVIPLSLVYMLNIFGLRRSN
ncbi:hypothetical protein [Fictibacillus phosphorivorans]|uniref:hypothetical protein n=1 Tax=Fictibacillus phosphorivorans TaxID=1221500 RepID=UPI00203A7292|nr:hypothetical protein [Fictibacillus phosphorivorans]MCM3718090.1 hypothetical protein [Fictibacillus phosphorivorans]MCM3775717.1 hypothetical protein [Fictibacillus phosphorivorans]